MPPMGVKWRRSMYYLPPVLPFGVQDFSGGLNTSEAPSELGEADTPDCMNITLDERGGLMMRLGLLRLNASALAGVAQYINYSPALDLHVIQIGATLYKTSDFVTITSFATFTTTARCSSVDYLDKLAVVHPVDGVFSYDGTTWALQTAAVKGTCLAPWQNKLFVSGDPRAGNASIVWWSNAGSFTFTTASDFNFIREKDGKPITAIGVGQGVDVAGRPGLLVFKDDSFYRINNSTTGAYVTMDAAAGCCGPMALTSLFGLVIFFSKRGIFTTDGVTPGATMASKKISNYFTAQQMNFGKLDGVAAGVRGNRVFFSFPWGPAQTTNNRTLEFHPLDGWLVPHSFGASCFTTYSKAESKLYSTSPTGLYVRETFRGGADEGVAIDARYQTRWYTVATGYLAQIQRLRVGGSGVFSLYVKRDYDQGIGELNAVSLIGNAFIWNDPGAVWNNAGMIWGPSVYESFQDFYDLGPAKAVSFVFKKTSLVAGSGPALSGDGASPEIGAFSVYSLLVDYVRLGYA